MEYTIHLTNKCNLNCKYCYEKNQKNNDEISFENIQKLIDRISETNSKNNIVYFYGGEPLLKKDIIIKTIEYVKFKKLKSKIFYGITTNGTLLDDEFILYIKENNFLNVAYSIDGNSNAHNLNRITKDGKTTHKIVEENAKKLLKIFPNAIAMMAITKNNIMYLDESVRYILDLGFKYINMQFNYIDDWKDEDLKIIKNQYEKVADIYAKKILEEQDVTINLFDDKIKTYIENNYDCNHSCQMGINSIQIDTNGDFYPCVHFVGIEKFIIGNCENGIDISARKNLISNSKIENNICIDCAYRKRCKHTCCCQNYVLTNDINGLTPIVCETEKIFIDISDKMAEKLNKANSKLFIQKYYNKNYNILKEIIGNKWK